MRCIGDLERRGIVVHATRTAASACEEVRRALLARASITKHDSSPVTVADFVSQAVVSFILHEHFPTVPLVAEERTNVLREPGAGLLLELVAERVGRTLSREVTRAEVLHWIDRGAGEPNDTLFWTLDPVDGTKGFLRGGQYAVALALIENGVPVVGSLACPRLSSDKRGDTGVLQLGVRGIGSWEFPMENPGAEGRCLAGADMAILRVVESVESEHSDHTLSAEVARRLGIELPPIRMDSQAKYAALTRGDASIYLRLPTSPSYREKIWDHAAGMLILQEAGGRVTDVDGRSLGFGHGVSLADNRGIIATRGVVHSDVVSAVRHISEGIG